ncbi:MAG TPA: zf-HC2 domain-containing protein [Vicinamibacterales bacterium]|nr:zf-HC2 domain-containing protein [Vicinamibacterales bacterium]
MTTPHPDDVTLNDFADGTLPAGRQGEVEAHLSSCGSCRAIVDGLRRVRSAVRQLPPLAAPRDGWTKLERTLRASSAAPKPRRWQWLAVAAALVVAVLGGMKLNEFRRGSPDTTRATTVDAPTAESIAAELQLAEQHYQNAISDLQRAANAEKGTLDPQVASTLEKNLAVVDQAISESRAALKAQPSSEPAQASLLENFKAKIALLQDTVALINEMRKGPSGNADGRRAVSGLRQKDS